MAGQTSMNEISYFEALSKGLPATHFVSWLPQGYQNVNTRTGIAMALLSVLGISIATRLLSGRGNQTVDHDVSAIYMPPYWLPGVGHLLDLVFRPDRLLKGTR